MERFKFYIDDQEVTHPNNFEEFSEDLIRDETKRHVYYDYPISLEFIGDAYELLDAQYKTDYNSQLSFRITEQTQTGVQVIFDAFIKISNITFDLVRKIASCEIDDTTYQAYLFSNYSVEAGCGSQTSKNGVDITKIESLDLIVYNPVTGIDEVEPRRAFDVKDAMSMMVAYVSDNTLTFESDWYDGLNDNEKLAIVTGFELRNHTGRTSPIVSLESLFTELWKKFNLYLIVENPINTPIVRLEEESYLYGDTKSEILYCENLSRSLDFDRLYSTIKLGSSKYIKERSTAFLFPYLRLFSFCDETYNLEGVVNVDNQLELVSEYIIDTNVIEDILVNDNDDYDEEIVLIQYNSSTNTAVKGEYFDTIDPASRLYNETLLNSNVADRFSYLGNLVLQTGEVNSGFRATQTIGQGTIKDFFGIENQWENTRPLQPIRFDDDSTPPNFDLQNDYDPTTWTFTAPSDGEYVFRIRFQINTRGTPVSPPGAGTAPFNFRIRLYTERNGALIEPTGYNVTQSLGVNGSLGSQDFTLNFDNNILFSQEFTIPIPVEITFIDLVQTVPLVAGDEVRGMVLLQAFTEFSALLNYGNLNSTFELLASPLSGGDYVVTDADDYYVNIYNADRILVSPDEWQPIRDNVSTQVLLSAPDGHQRISYAKQISRNFVTGSTDIETVFNRKQPII